MGLKDSECGQIGVTMIAGTLGWIMDAPAATAYAVLPVGVDTMRPLNETHDADIHQKEKDTNVQSASNSKCFALR